MDSYGPEALELAERAGLHADPWQDDGVTAMLAVRDDGKWAALKHAEIIPRQNGKSLEFYIRALAGFFLLSEKLVMWSAHEYRTAQEAFLKILDLIANLGERVNDTRYDVDGIPVKISNTNGDEGFIRLDTRQRIKFLARSKSAGRGFSGDVSIVDEAFALTDEQYAAFLPAMSARPNPQVLFGSSPPLDGASGGVLYRLRARALAIRKALDAGEPVTDDRLGLRDWGLQGVDLDDVGKSDPRTGRLIIDLDDRRLWALTNPAFNVVRADGSGVNEEFSAIERGSMSPTDFARERIGVWPRQLEASGGQIDLQAWMDLEDAESRRMGAVAIAVDIAPDRSWSAVCVFGARADELGHGQLVDYRPGTDWLVGRLVELRAGLTPLGFAMARGTAASLEPELRKVGITRPENPDEPRYGDLAVLTAVDMAAACGQIIDAVKLRSFRVVPAQPLTLAVPAARTRVTGDTIAWTRKDSTVDITPVVALTEARWLYETWAPLLAKPYDALDNIW